MQSSMLRTSAFSGSNVARAPTMRGPASRAPVVVVQASQEFKGVVVSTAMQNTIVVNVERLSPHNKYFKRIRSSKRYVAHAEDNSCQVGDYVRLQPAGRALSATKRFKLVEVIRAADN